MCREPVLKGWLIILPGCLWVVSFGVGMASLHYVPSTCGCDFFIPPLDRPISSHLFELLEVVICHSSEEGAVSVNMTFTTVSGDVVHTLVVRFNQTAQVLMGDLIMKHRDIGRYGVKLTASRDVSVYGQMTYESDVMTLVPLAAMATSYLVPDLRTSLLEEQKMRLVVFSLVKNNSVTLTAYSRFYGNESEEMRDNSNTNVSITDTTKLNKTAQSEDNSIFTATSAANKTTRRYNFTAAFMTQYLIIESDVTVFLQSDSPIGVMVLVTLPSSLEITSESVTASSGKVEQSLNGGSLGDEEVVAAEMVLPSWSMGALFYLPVLPVMSTVNFVISGQHNTTVNLRVHTKSSTDFATHPLAAYTSLLIEQPIKEQQTSGHVWLSATSPVLVYVVIDVCVPGDRDASCFANGFFLPPLQQFFRCAANKSDGVCQVQCPSFWHLSPCLWNQWSPSDSSPGGGSASSVKDSNNNVWEVKQTVSETSINVTDLCIVTNDTYMHFRLDLTSASFLPSGSSIGHPYNACVQHVIDRVGDEYKTGNDCHYTIDEEALKQIDEQIDKDTSSECVQDMIARNTRGDTLQRMVDPLDRFLQYQDEDSQMPLLAVITSLTVAILAVIGVISIYLLMEVMSRRRQIRNTKIRPFVS